MGTELIQHAGRTIATIEGEAGSVEIPAATLGLGPSIIQARAVFPEDGPAADADQQNIRETLGPINIVRSAPIEVRIDPEAITPNATLQSIRTAAQKS